MKQKVKVKGTARIILRDEAGNIKADRLEDNLIVDTGLQFLAVRAVGTADNVMSHMAIGSGTTLETAIDTTLETELGRVALNTVAAPTSGVITYTASFPPGTGTGAVTEAGIFNNDPGGIMLNRITFAVINKAVGDTIDITWTVTFLDDGV
jgi:hypothetical protein